MAPILPRREQRYPPEDQADFFAGLFFSADLLDFFAAADLLVDFADFFAPDEEERELEALALLPFDPDFSASDSCASASSSAVVDPARRFLAASTLARSAATKSSTSAC